VAIPAWLTIISWIFISIGLLSAALILADIYLAGYREDVTIMEAVWPLTALVRRADRPGCLRGLGPDHLTPMAQTPRF